MNVNVNLKVKSRFVKYSKRECVVYGTMPIAYSVLLWSKQTRRASHTERTPFITLSI